MQCIIVDDEPLAVQLLESYIENIPSLQLVGSYHHAFAAMDKLSHNKVDLIFMDIHLPKLMGHEFIRSLSYSPHVIFTTAYREFALDAFDLHAVDYLLKPITLERFLKAINKLQANVEPLKINKTEEFIDSKDFIYVRADRKMVKIFYDEIEYVESVKDYIKIVRTEGRAVIVKQSITSLINLLPQNYFQRIHRSYIVSLNKIKSYSRNSVEIKSMEIPIGRMYQNLVATSLTSKTTN